MKVQKQTTRAIEETHYNKIKKIDAWSAQQKILLEETQHLPKKIIFALHECVALQSKFIADMFHMQNMLAILQNKGNLNARDKATIDEYTEKVNKLLELFNEWEEAFPLITDENTSIENAIDTLNKRFTQGNHYIKIVDTLLDLQNMEEAVNNIYNVKKRREALYKDKEMQIASGIAVVAGSDIPPPAARELPLLTATPKLFYMTKMSMPVQEISKILSKELIPEQRDAQKSTEDSIIALTDLTNAAKETIQAKTQHINAQKAADEVSELAQKVLPKNSSNKAEVKKIVLADILSLKINTKAQNIQLASVAYFSDYAKNLLANAYPEFFQLNNKVFTINSTSPKCTNKDIYLALGLEENQPIHLEPAQFDKDKLDDLFDIVKNPEPLWIVLKSTKPIDNTFTPEDKIQAYLEVAEAYRHGLISTEGKYLAAYTMAMSAFAIATEYPQYQKYAAEVFGAESTMGKWIIERHKYHHQNWKDVTKQLNRFAVNQSPVIDDKDADKDSIYNSGNTTPTDEASTHSDENVGILELQGQLDTMTKEKALLEEELSAARETTVMMHDIEQDNENLRTTQFDLERQLQEFIQSNSDLTRDLETVHWEKEALDHQLISAQQEIKNSRLQNELMINLFNDELEALKSQLKKITSELDAAVRANASGELDKDKAQKQIEDKNTEIILLNQKIESITHDLSSLTEKLAASVQTEEKLIQTQKTLDKAQEELIQLRKEQETLHSATQKIALLEKELSALKTARTSDVQQIAEKTTKIQQQEQTIQQITAQLANLTQELKEKGSIEETLLVTQKKLDSAQNDLAQLQQVNDELQKAKQTMTQLEKNLADAKEAQAANEQAHNTDQEFIDRKFALMDQLLDLNSGEEQIKIPINENAIMSQRIKKAKNMDELDEVEQELNSLTKINIVVKKVVDELNARKDLHSFFASPAYKKIAAIEKAFNELPINDRLSLCQLNEETMIETSKGKDTPLEKFLHEINKHRISFSSGKTTAFTQFIEGIQELNKENGAKDSDELGL